MTNNMPILYRNVMGSLPSDFARDAFLWAVERPNEDRYCYRAENFAREADKLVSQIIPLLDAGAEVLGFEHHDPDLLKFIMKRHANWRYGGNVAPGYVK